MTRDEILQAIKDLAKSQGFYGRLLRDMSDELLDALEAQGFTDVVDLVLFLEG
jgi:hypothetical protein